MMLLSLSWSTFMSLAGEGLALRAVLIPAMHSNPAAEDSTGAAGEMVPHSVVSGWSDQGLVSTKHVVG